MANSLRFSLARRSWRVLLPALAVGALSWVWLADVSHAQRAGGGPRRPGGGAQPVTAAAVKLQDMPVWLTALGTVTPHRLVNVMPRVSGLLQSIAYKQGQQVRAGQLLAQIDPRPFHIAVEQATAQLEQAQAQLAGARGDLVRYETLLKQQGVSEQQVADQRASVAQLKATVDADRAALDNARLQLTWTRITAPVSGIVGLRTVDAGNMVGTSGVIGGGTAGSAAPVVVIAQIQPVEVTFALPQQQGGEVLARLSSGASLTAQAWDPSDTRMLAAGRLVAADNQISTATGTLNMRAAFANRDMALFPNAFVNLRLLLRTEAYAVVVPTTAIAVGAPGTYVYVVGAGGKVAMRSVRTGVAFRNLTQVVAGLKPGEIVVTDGLDRLHEGAQVRVVTARAPGASAAAASAPRRFAHAAAGAKAVPAP